MGFPYELLRLVWGLDSIPRNQRRVLEILAIHANTDGTQARPSIATIAKAAGWKDRRSTRRVLVALERAGLIEAVANRRGGTRPGAGRGGATTIWRIRFDRLRELVDNPGDSEADSRGLQTPPVTTAGVYDTRQQGSGDPPTALYQNLMDSKGLQTPAVASPEVAAWWVARIKDMLKRKTAEALGEDT